MSQTFRFAAFFISLLVFGCTGFGPRYEWGGFSKKVQHPTAEEAYQKFAAKKEHEQQIKNEERARRDEYEAARLRIEEEKQNKIQAQKDVIVGLAAKKGYKSVLFDNSLSSVLSDIINGYSTLDEYDRVVIVLSSQDRGFRALQVMAASSIYVDSSYEAVLVLKNPAKGTIIEGSPLTSRAGAVIIKGVTSYKALLRSKQAFVIEEVEL